MVLAVKKLKNQKRRFSSRKNRAGFSLAEAMVATVVLAIAAAGVLLPFVSGAAVRAEGTHRTLAAKLAADLTEEIVSTEFSEIVNYNGYSELQGQITDANGVVFTDSNYANFSRDVSCEYIRLPQQSPTQPEEFILITVRVYYNGNEIAVVNRLVGPK